MKILSLRFELPEPEHRAFKILATQRQTSMTAVVLKLIRQELAAAKEPTAENKAPT